MKLNQNDDICPEINKVYCMDNLELMKQMPDSYIDLIYCDVLYGTGRKFDDFQDLKPDRQIIEDFYIPRIKEMHRILKNTGSIYLQMDYRIVHWIRIIMDDIFSYDNFRNEIIWSYRRWTATSNSFQNMHDNILFYSKSNTYIFNEQYEITERLKKVYKQGYNTNTTKTGKRQILITNKSKVKNIDLSTYDEVIYKEEKGTLINDVWNLGVLASNSKERVGYATQKPKALLERIIKASSNKGDIVADFFCGSGTTGVVAEELGRNYIMCDINPKAVEISERRISEAQNKPKQIKLW